MCVSTPFVSLFVMSFQENFNFPDHALMAVFFSKYLCPLPTHPAWSGRIIAWFTGHFDFALSAVPHACPLAPPDRSRGVRQCPRGVRPRLRACRARRMDRAVRAPDLGRGAGGSARGTGRHVLRENAGGVCGSGGACHTATDRQTPLSITCLWTLGVYTPIEYNMSVDSRSRCLHTYRVLCIYVLFRLIQFQIYICIYIHVHTYAYI